MIEPLLQAERALATGLIDQAEALFAATLEADPRNAIALVGLARVRLERGDEAAALRLGRQALAIDRDNPVAQRLVARLAEVAAHRAANTPATAEPQEVPESPPSAAASASAAATPAPSPTPAAPRKPGFVARLLRRR